MNSCREGRETARKMNAFSRVLYLFCVVPYMCNALCRLRQDRCLVFVVNATPRKLNVMYTNTDIWLNT